MSAIILRCKTCKHAMKFSAEKAGKRAKCPKCDAIVLIQANEDPAGKTQAPAAPAPAPKPDDEDDGGAYEIFVDPEIEELRKKRAAEEEAAARKKRGRKDLPKVGRKVKAIADGDSWDKVRLGMLLLFLGVCIWTFTHLLQGTYLLMGTIEIPEYANLMAEEMAVRGGDGELPPFEDRWNLDKFNMCLGMIAGRDTATFAFSCLTLATVLYFFQAMAWALGYLCCLAAPNRFGTFGQICVALGLAFFNFLFMFIFKLLPILNVHSYILIPYVMPEIVMTEYNMDRQMPIHLLLSGAPFWENFFNIFLRTLHYLEPTFAAIFIWSVGKSIKDERIEEAGKGMTQLSLGTLFVLLSFFLLAMCGATPVLVNVARVFYGVWFFFLLLFQLQFALLLLQCRGVLYDKINPANELVD